MDGAGNGTDVWPNVAQGQVRVFRTFLVFTSDAAKPVVSSGVVVGFDRRYALGVSGASSCALPNRAEKETGFGGGWSRAGVYHVRYDAIAFDGATIAIPDQGEPGVIVARGVAAHFAAATNHRGGFGRCGYAGARSRKFEPLGFRVSVR
jgi:hypothetical protein